MSEHEQDQTNEDGNADESAEEFAQELEDDPAYAGGEDEPGDELRGG